MPEKIAHWKLTDLCGVGRRMEPRLHSAGILTVEDLWNAAPEDLRQVWGGVGGDRFWHELHGEDLGHFATQTRSIGHSHVLAPEFRKPPEAVIVARRLLFKAASRMRREGYRTSLVSLSVRTEDRNRGDADMRLPRHASDTFTLMQTLEQLWPVVMGQVRWARLKKVAVTLLDLEANSTPEQLELFPEMSLVSPEDVARREKLSSVMDTLNQRYGRDSIAVGFVPNQVKTFSGTKIAFTRIPDKEEFRE
jgi:DNA polymerase-4